MTARRRSGISLPGGVVTLLLGCLAWQVLANYGVTARLLSSPWDIGTAIVTLQVARSPQLYVHILSSMLRTLIATESAWQEVTFESLAEAPISYVAAAAARV